MDTVLIRMLQLSQKGYSCSQILILLALESAGRSNPELVRAMAGLAYGCGSGRATCGTLSGGCCLLALYAAKGDDAETASERLSLMQQELCDWFEAHVGQRYGGITCEQITGQAGPAASQQVCGGIVGDTYAKVMTILVENGFSAYP